MTVRSSLVRRRAMGLTVLLLGAAATTACSPGGGAAAVVDGRAVPVADLQAAAGELGPYLDGATPSSLLLVLVAEPTVTEVAAENGVAVSEQEAEQQLAAVVADDPEAPDFGPAAVTVARFSLLQQELGQLPDAEEVQADILSRLRDLDIDVNPRYGELDFDRGGIAPVEHPWLVPEAP
ncbi:hypothetical protein [Cellulomonas aerilata]|uniref:Lipoprotein n=1 Tax=Cellulomonas aerilata TaxID=515326 RepID=A0A512DDV3_9CELL|nr:hypothetical protein [Cellulomonas aerilata]GEO34649.1 hypothetical protein CAE01nite_23740 [Cellulomonas aerilata]